MRLDQTERVRPDLIQATHPDLADVEPRTEFGAAAPRGNGAALSTLTRMEQRGEPRLIRASCGALVLIDKVGHLIAEGDR